MKPVCKYLSGRSIADFKKWPRTLLASVPQFHAIVQGEKRYKLNIFLLKKLKVSTNKAMCLLLLMPKVSLLLLLLNESFSATDIRGRQ